jgi:hypothetical protein
VGAETLTAAVMAIATEVIQDVLGREKDGEVPAIGPETRLYGTGGHLGSLALVTFVVEMEQTIADRLGVTVALADERALSQRESPYKTVATLVDYAVREIEARRERS